MRETQSDNVSSLSRNNDAEDKIFVVGRDAFSSELLAAALSRHVGWVALSVSPASVSKAIASGKARLAIVNADLSSIAGEGFDLANSISHTHPDMAIIIVLSEASPEAVMRAFRSGASGVFCQEEPMTELLHCIEHVANRLIWAGQNASVALLEILKNIPSPGTLVGSETGESLTARELQVVQCAATGKTNRLIAAQLHLSEHTVKNYLFRAFAKLGVSSRVELIFYLSLRGTLATRAPHDLNGGAHTDFSREGDPAACKQQDHPGRIHAGGELA